ncbi:hypothetical protein ACFX16_032868 [Malus domestica]
MKNHQARPTGATDVPEAHYSTNQCPKHQKRCGRGCQKPPIKVNRAKAHLREETKPINALTTLQRPQTSRMRVKHLTQWMRICAIAMVQMTIGPVFTELPRRL